MKKLFSLIFLQLLLGVFAFAQEGQFDQPTPFSTYDGATAAICRVNDLATPCVTSAVTLYLDRAKAQSQSNPIKLLKNKNLTFYADPGWYLLQQFAPTVGYNNQVIKVDAPNAPQVFGLVPDNVTTINSCPSNYVPAQIVPTNSGQYYVMSCFAPATVGTVTQGSVIFLGNVQNNATAHLTVTPTSLSFPNTVQGQTSQPMSVTVLNDGVVDVHITSVSVVGPDFSISADGCSTLLNQILVSGNSCQISAVFNPTTTGSLSDNITIANTTPVPQILVGLSGTGTTPAAVDLTSVSLSPASFSGLVGSTQQLIATINFSDGSTQPCTSCVFLSSDTSKATVSSSGLVTIVGSGSFTISAMAANYKQSWAASGSDTNTTRTLTLPGNSAQGDAYVAVVGFQAAATPTCSVTDSSGNTYSQVGTSASGNSLGQQVFLAKNIPATTSPASITATCGTAEPGLDLRAFEIAGVLRTGTIVDPLSGAGSIVSANGNSTTTATVAIITTVAPDILIDAIMTNQNVTAQGGGFCCDNLDSGQGNSIGYAPGFAATTYNPTGTLSSSGTFLIQALALKSVGGSSSGTGTGNPANVRYIDPNGSDSNDGLAPVLGGGHGPWKTFSHAVPLLTAGLTLDVMPGKFTATNGGAGQGVFYANCGTGGNANKGNSGAHITVQGFSERLGGLYGSATAVPAYMVGCSYWDFNGLYFENGDFQNQVHQDYNDTFGIANSDHITVNRSVFNKDNRYNNVHLLDMQGCTPGCSDSFNEFYNFHRHAMIYFGGSNGWHSKGDYMNSRGYADLPNCTLGSGGGTIPRCSSDSDRGDAAIYPYGSMNGTAVNTISEGQGRGTDCEPNAGQGCSGNHIYGLISLHDKYGFYSDNHSNSYPPPSTQTYQDFAIIHPDEFCGWLRDSDHMTVNHVACWTPTPKYTTIVPYGFIFDKDSGGTLGNNLIQNTAVDGLPCDAAGCGFAMSASGGNSATASFDNLSNLAAGVGTINGMSINNITTVNPNNGNCYIRILSTSNLHGIGSGGSDIGPSVLYFKNDDGSDSATPMFLSGTNPPTLNGAGAIIPGGINDPATPIAQGGGQGASLADFTLRANIGTNGCPLPY